VQYYLGAFNVFVYQFEVPQLTFQLYMVKGGTSVFVYISYLSPCRHTTRPSDELRRKTGNACAELSCPYNYILCQGYVKVTNRNMGSTGP
jgi:hypothetical protein